MGGTAGSLQFILTYPAGLIVTGKIVSGKTCVLNFKEIYCALRPAQSTFIPTKALLRYTTVYVTRHSFEVKTSWHRQTKNSHIHIYMEHIKILQIKLV